MKTIKGRFFASETMNPRREYRQGKKHGLKAPHARQPARNQISAEENMARDEKKNFTSQAISEAKERHREQQELLTALAREREAYSGIMSPLAARLEYYGALTLLVVLLVAMIADGWSIAGLMIHVLGTSSPGIVYPTSFVLAVGMVLGAILLHRKLGEYGKKIMSYWSVGASILGYVGVAVLRTETFVASIDTSHTMSPVILWGCVSLLTVAYTIGIPSVVGILMDLVIDLYRKAKLAFNHYQAVGMASSSLNDWTVREKMLSDFLASLDGIYNQRSEIRLNSYEKGYKVGVQKLMKRNNGVLPPELTAAIAP